MARTVAIGIQSFEEIRKQNCFYVDKTDFIKEWWENGDDVTLITRPLSITNYEVLCMFYGMVKQWFKKEETYYNEFIKAMLAGNLDEMNDYMNEVALSMFGYFDTGKRPGGTYAA